MKYTDEQRGLLIDARAKISEFSRAAAALSETISEIECNRFDAETLLYAAFAGYSEDLPAFGELVGDLIRWTERQKIRGDYREPTEDDPFSDDLYGSRPGEGGIGDYQEGPEPLKWEE
jgi:hypothetical protein